jgi:hypothetical protein
MARMHGDGADAGNGAARDGRPYRGCTEMHGDGADAGDGAARDGRPYRRLFDSLREKGSKVGEMIWG